MTTPAIFIVDEKRSLLDAEAGEACPAQGQPCDSTTPAPSSCRCQARSMACTAARRLVGLVLLFFLISSFMRVVNAPWCPNMAAAAMHNGAADGGKGRDFAGNRPAHVYMVMRQGLPDVDGARESRVFELPMRSRH